MMSAQANIKTLGPDTPLCLTALLLRAIEFLEAQPNSTRSTGCVPSPAQAQTLKVSVAGSDQDGGSVFVGYPSGVQAVVFKGSEAPELQTIGKVPPLCQQSWKFATSALHWIHADVCFNGTEQRSILVPNAHCFGSKGRDAIVDGNMELSKSIAFAVPHTIQLDAQNAMVVWDFDVIDRQTCSTIGRGTDFVHFCPNGQVFQVDTIRHQGSQPSWASWGRAA